MFSPSFKQSGNRAPNVTEAHTLTLQHSSLAENSFKTSLHVPLPRVVNDYPRKGHGLSNRPESAPNHDLRAVPYNRPFLRLKYTTMLSRPGQDSRDQGEKSFKTPPNRKFLPSKGGTIPGRSRHKPALPSKKFDP